MTKVVSQNRERWRGSAASDRGVQSFYADRRRPANAIRVCDGTSCQLAGATQLHDRIRQSGAATSGVYCLGHCHQSPALLDASGHLYVDDQARTFVPPQSDEGDPAIAEAAICCKAPISIVTTRLANGGASDLPTARRRGAYAAFESALERPSAEVLDAMERSGERGRGGAGFSTAQKWRTAARVQAERKVVVANGDEGDPGSFIDRVLMESDPHAIIEGMLLCAHAIGATDGIVYVRSEYPAAVAAMNRAVAEATDVGYTARLATVAGGFSLTVVVGKGSYVCGEETALLQSIAGRRGEVQLRPPYPAEKGLDGWPTVVNNVETLVNVPFIVATGGVEFSALGTKASSGTKALCLNHGFARPGIVEVEFGVSLHDVIKDFAGGGRNGEPLAAVIVGGPMGSVLTPDEWDVAVCYEAMKARGFELGHGGLVAVPESTDFRALLRHWMQFMVDESCGRCAPCRLGSYSAVQVLDDESSDVRRRLDGLFEIMESGSLCAFGRLMPGPMRQLIQHFGDRIFPA